MIVLIEIQTVPQSFPAGTVGGDWRFSVYNAENQLVEEKRTQLPSASFDLPAGENYRADGGRLDDAGMLLGPVKTITFDVSDTTPVQIAVADGITATQVS